MSPLPVFIDRDGVINENRQDYVRTLDQWIPITGAFRALALLSGAGHEIVIVTNQSGIARGYTTIHDVEQIHNELIRLAVSAGAVISGIYYCPHHPGQECGCRKPSIGMVESARRDLRLPAGGYMIGDAASDIEFGHRAGLRTILVLTGRGRDQLRKMKSTGDGMPWMVVRDLTEAVEVILSDH